jgi:hypothetical protein
MTARAGLRSGVDGRPCDWGSHGTAPGAWRSGGQALERFELQLGRVRGRGLLRFADQGRQGMLDFAGRAYKPRTLATHTLGGDCNAVVRLRLGCVPCQVLPRSAEGRALSSDNLWIRGATHNPKVVGSNPTPATTNATRG